MNGNYIIACGYLMGWFLVGLESEEKGNLIEIVIYSVYSVVRTVIQIMAFLGKVCATRCGVCDKANVMMQKAVKVLRKCLSPPLIQIPLRWIPFGRIKVNHVLYKLSNPRVVDLGQLWRGIVVP